MIELGTQYGIPPQHEFRIRVRNRSVHLNLELLLSLFIYRMMFKTMLTGKIDQDLNALFVKDKVCVHLMCILYDY